MTFLQMLGAFIGHTVEVVVPSQIVVGILQSVQPGQIQVEVVSPIYGPPGTIVSVATGKIDFVRVFP